MWHIYATIGIASVKIVGNTPIRLQIKLEKFCKIVPRGLYCKGFQNRNLWEIDKFRSKLVSSAQEKH